MPGPRWQITRATLADLRALGWPIVDLLDGRVFVSGRAFEIVDAPASDAILICAEPPGNFADDVTTHCAGCARAIVHRPHAPAALKLCQRCARRRVAADASKN